MASSPQMLGYCPLWFKLIPPGILDMNFIFITLIIGLAPVLVGVEF